MNRVSKKIVGITGSRGALGSKFVKKYKTKFNFKNFKDKIENKKKFDYWLKKNSDINYFVHLAAISSIRETNKNPRKTYKINSSAPINIIKKLNNAKLKNFQYFLFSSSSHVYKPSLNDLSEKSTRKPSTIYGKSKKVEDFIFKNNKKIRFKIGIARIFNFYSKKHGRGFFVQDIKRKLSINNKIIKINKINTMRDYIDLNQLCEILYFMLSKEISKAVNVGSGNRLNLINLITNKKDINLKINWILKIKDIRAYLLI